jgi:cyclophilin family peptidyl-prolyl cis-trans isomerase
MQWTEPPAMAIDKKKDYTAVIKTNYGDITTDLFPSDAPLAVNNFVFLSKQGYYDNVKVIRVVKGFVIQTGDPTGTGRGGPGYKFADEKVTKDYLPGTLAMANAGPNTNGSQFFICLANLSGQLPKNYTIFGQVIKGMDAVKKIEAVPTKMGFDGSSSSPTVEVTIESITITEE